MLTQILNTLYHRDLNKLKEELNAYASEESIWAVKDGISNSAGNLTLHLIGNLNHFIGATLGNSGYVREREKEFSLKNIPRHELIRNIDETIVVVQQTLLKLTQADLEKTFPIQVMQVDNTTGPFDFSSGP